MSALSNATTVLEECFLPANHHRRQEVQENVQVEKVSGSSLRPENGESSTMTKYEELIRQLREENETLKNSVHINPAFRWIVRVAVVLSALAFLLMIVLAFQGEMSATQDKLFEICDNTWKIGFATIIGLIGGKIS